MDLEARRLAPDETLLQAALVRGIVEKSAGHVARSSG
jgi:hypothetical protein